MHHDLETFASEAALADRACDVITTVARDAIALNGRFVCAVSGGATPWATFKALAATDLPWSKIVMYQVDERVVPTGDPDRNLTNLTDALGAAQPDLRPMPVEDEDLVAAARRYGDGLPERFDLIHLGIGPDGHTASLVPGDPVLEVADQPIALTGPYQGHPRMTLTYPAIARAEQLVWLIAGADKRDALAKLLRGDPSIPAGRVEAARSLVLAEHTAV